MKQPQRGPERQPMSKIKIGCGFKKCTTGIDVKNKPFELAVEKVALELCRNLRSHVKKVKFCCQRHLDKCLVKPAPVKRGGREPLTPEQLGCLFATLKHQCPWAAALMVLQLCLGERADAARQASTTWFQNMAPHSLALPVCHIPHVNLKTTERTIPLDRGFAELLWGWMTSEPLESQGKQWPFLHQDLKKAFASGAAQLLFPGRVLGGVNKRDFSKPITEKAYLDAIHAACKSLAHEQKLAQQNGQPHPCEDLDLTKVGTHSMKKSLVTMMKSKKISTSIVSAITGTSCRTLDENYDIPTHQRQRHAFKSTLSPVLENLDKAMTST